MELLVDETAFLETHFHIVRESETKREEGSRKEGKVWMTKSSPDRLKQKQFGL